MMSQGGSNAHVKALESKIIDVVDGQEIMGKTKAGKKVKSIKNPNCQILLYTQPETISTYLKANIIDSGLLGRMIITVHGSAEDPFDQVFKRKHKSQKKFVGRAIRLTHYSILSAMCQQFTYKINSTIKAALVANASALTSNRHAC